MSLNLSRTLYVRVNRPLHADLLAAAEAAGSTPSALARDLLRAGLDRPQDRDAATRAGLPNDHRAD